MKNKIKYLFVLAVIFTVVSISAQVVPPPIPPPPPPGLPIDGGVFFLLLSGIIYGVKKIKAN